MSMQFTLFFRQSHLWLTRINLWVMHSIAFNLPVQIQASVSPVRQGSIGANAALALPDEKVPKRAEAIRRYYTAMLSGHPNFVAGEQSPALLNGGLAFTLSRQANGSVTDEIARRPWRAANEDGVVKSYLNNSYLCICDKGCRRLCLPKPGFLQFFTPFFSPSNEWLPGSSLCCTAGMRRWVNTSSMAPRSSATTRPRAAGTGTTVAVAACGTGGY